MQRDGEAASGAAGGVLSFALIAANPALTRTPPGSSTPNPSTPDPTVDGRHPRARSAQAITRSIRPSDQP